MPQKFAPLCGPTSRRRVLREGQDSSSQLVPHDHAGCTGLRRVVRAAGAAVSPPLARPKGLKIPPSSMISLAQPSSVLM